MVKSLKWNSNKSLSLEIIVSQSITEHIVYKRFGCLLYGVSNSEDPD